MPNRPSLSQDGKISKRAAQKIETRRRLLAAARDLMARGVSVNVAAAAHEAGLSVATAYRYFSEPETLRIEAGLELDMGASGTFLDQFATEAADLAGIAERVILAHRLMVDFVRRNEAMYRMFIAKGHEQVVRDTKTRKTSPRGGRRLPLLESAVEPLRQQLGAERTRDLVLALMAVSGPEPEFVLRDVGRLSNPEIDRITEQILRDLVAAHLGRAGLAPKAG